MRQRSAPQPRPAATGAAGCAASADRPAGNFATIRSPQRPITALAIHTSTTSTAKPSHSSCSDCLIGAISRRRSRSFVFAAAAALPAPRPWKRTAFLHHHKLQSRGDMPRPALIAGAFATVALVIVAGGCGFKSEPTGALSPRPGDGHRRRGHHHRAGRRAQADRVAGSRHDRAAVRDRRGRLCGRPKRR